MAGSVNKVILLGNVGQDPDIRTMQNGKKVCNLSIATSDTWKDKESGEKKEKTEWHRVVVFNEGLVGIVEQYIKKGAKLYIEGSLQTRKWTDDAGNEKYTTEVVLQNYNGRIDMIGGKNTNQDTSYDGDAIKNDSIKTKDEKVLEDAKDNVEEKSNNADEEDIPF